MQVAGGAAGALRRLSGPGAAQLAADLDYFCNELAALGVALSPSLLTWQARAPGQGIQGAWWGTIIGFRLCRCRRCSPGGRAFMSGVGLYGKAEWQHASPPA